MRAPMGNAPAILFRSSDVEVLDFGSTIRFKRRGLAEIGLGLLGVVVGGLFAVGSHGWPPFTTRAPSGFEDWGSLMLLLLGGVLVLMGLAGRIAPPWELNSELRCLKRGFRRVSFDEIRGVDVTETRMGSVTAVALRLESTRGVIWLVRGQRGPWRDALQRVRERVMAQLGQVSSASSREVRANSPVRFLAAFAFAFGAWWTSMVWIAPDAVMVSTVTHDGYGLRLWPLGPWFAALGLGELVGLKPLQTLLGPWNRRRVIVTLVWFGSYCAVAFVRL